MTKKNPRSAKGLDTIFAELAENYGKEDFLCAIEEIKAELVRWTPGCNKERSYTYQHVSEVDKCPQNENQEANYEAEAKKLAEDKVKRFCERNKNNCTGIKIIDSSPTAGGCNCFAAGPFGKKCVYTCMWTVKYKCEQKPA